MKNLNKRSPFSSSRPFQSCAHSWWTAKYYSNCAEYKLKLLQKDDVILKIKIKSVTSLSSMIFFGMWSGTVQGKKKKINNNKTNNNVQIPWKKKIQNQSLEDFKRHCSCCTVYSQRNFPHYFVTYNMNFHMDASGFGASKNYATVVRFVLWINVKLKRNVSWKGLEFEEKGVKMSCLAYNISYCEQGSMS